MPSKDGFADETGIKASICVLAAAELTNALLDGVAETAYGTLPRPAAAALGALCRERVIWLSRVPA
jgi:hypothetical protein